MTNTPIGDFPVVQGTVDLTSWYNIPPPVPTDQLILQKLTEIGETLKGIEKILWNNG